jgi:hypothetical protein
MVPSIMKKLVLGISLLAFLAMASSSFAVTAFEARQIAEKMLNDQSRGKLIKIVGPKGEGTTPESWRFIFYDPFANQNGRLIVVTGKGVTEIRDGYVELDAVRLASYKEDEILSPNEVKIDSDKALALVQKASLLQSVKLSAVKYELKKTDSNVVPIWILTLYADVKGQNTEIGTAKLSAENGQIFDLKIDNKKLQ